MYTEYEFGYLEQCCWRFRSSGMWKCVIGVGSSWRYEGSYAFSFRV